MKITISHIITIIILIIILYITSLLTTRYIIKQNRLKVLQESIYNEKLQDLIDLANKYTINSNIDDKILSSMRTHINTYKQRNKYHKKKLLCCTFVKSVNKSLNSLTTKLQSNNSNECDWIIYVYGGNMSLAKQYNENTISYINEYHTKVLLFEYNITRQEKLLKYGIYPSSNAESIRSIISNSNSLYNKLIYPKPLLITSLLLYIRKYHYIWVFDEDISISNMNITKLLLIIECSSFPSPIISQPLVFENTQAYKYLNYKSWNKSTVTMAQTKFIEIQTPIFKADFLEYYIKNVISRLLYATHVLGADWGLDSLFCPLAELYSIELYIYNYKRQFNHHISQSNSSSTNYNPFNALTLQEENKLRLKLSNELVSCAVIVDDLYVNHYDNKSIDVSVGYSKRKALNHALVDIIHRVFSKYTLNGLIDNYNPLNKRSNLKLFYHLNDTCVSKYNINSLTN